MEIGVAIGIETDIDHDPDSDPATDCDSDIFIRVGAAQRQELLFCEADDSGAGEAVVQTPGLRIEEAGGQTGSSQAES